MIHWHIVLYYIM